MCGIMGYVGERPAVDVLLKGLKRLEYRGYDSTGVAFFLNDKIEIQKSEGKLERVQKLIENEVGRFGNSRCGIGHTRWATHGRPTTQNAHPHQTGHVVLVHNGIIENYQEIKADLIRRGHQPQSETDSELFGFLILDRMESGLSLVESVRQSFQEIEGQCSIVALSEKEPGTIVGVRNGSPLVVARDPQGGTVFASDAQPLLEYSRDVLYLENGDVVVGTQAGVEVFELHSGAQVEREWAHLDWSADKLDKQGFPHYMLKEIYEQPTTLIDTINGILDREHTDPFPFADHPGTELLKNASQLTLLACGSSWHAALLGKYWLERFAKISVQVELASEFRYRMPVLADGSVIVGVSQSGETADTLAVIREVKKQGIPTVAITNVRGSTISRDADAVFFTCAGPEIGVAATKTFTAQMLMLLLWAGYLGIQREKAPMESLFQDLIKLPHLLKESLNTEGEMVRAIDQAVNDILPLKGFFFIGRGYSFPLALEGALKLKEIAYVHAEGYAAGELKHGPIAMIDEGMGVIVLAPRDTWRDKTISNLEEVKARGARIIGIGAGEDHALKGLCHHWIPLPPSSTALDEALLPFLVTPVVQLLSYGLAKLKGTDVDQPRNLAKSVTVE